MMILLKNTAESKNFRILKNW